MSGEKIEQYWDVKVVKDNPTYPFILIDNWYTPNEEKAVWKELDFLSPTPRELMDRAENTIVARTDDGKSKSNAYRFYQKREISSIINCTYKQRSKEFDNIIKECMPYARSFFSSNEDSAMLSYYEEKDYYDSH